MQAAARLASRGAGAGAVAMVRVGVERAGDDACGLTAARARARVCVPTARGGRTDTPVYMPASMDPELAKGLVLSQLCV